MHTTELMKSEDFLFSVDGKKSTIDDIFKDFNEKDRVGVIVSKTGGVVGTSALLLAAITRFYDFHRTNLGNQPDQLRIYPDFFIFHVGQLYIDGFFLDIWPPHKDVVVEDDPEQILEAVNDRGITRLIVEDIEPVEGVFLKETLSSAKSRIKTAVAYSSSGRTKKGNIEVVSCKEAEKMVNAAVTQSESISDNQSSKIIKQRKRLVENGKVKESYNTVELEQALNMLTDHNLPSETTKKYFAML